MKRKNLLFLGVAMTFFNLKSEAQIVGTDAFLFGNGVEIGIHNDGYEGSAALPPFPSHYRGFSGRLGFLANPAADGWTNYNGDFFMPGSPENRFGIEVDGTTYFNSSATGSSITSYGLSNYQEIDRCKFVDWDGSAAGVDIHMTYKLDTTKLYYTVSVTLTNTNVVDKNDVYFYKSLDPDNNQDIGWGFATLNTIEYQPSPACPKALVSAYDNNGWDSYIGLGGIDENMRVSYGGFFINDASDVWNAVPPYVGTTGSSLLADQAIAICQKVDVLPAGASKTFEFVVVLNEVYVNEAMLELIYFTFDGGPGLTASCSSSSGSISTGGVVYSTDGVADTVYRCTEEPQTLWVEAPAEVISSANLAWMDEDDTLSEESYTVIIPGTEADTAHIICYLTLGDCWSGAAIANEYVVITIQTPEIYVPEQEFCGDSVLLADVEVIDTANVDDALTNYYTEYPDVFDDASIFWTDPYIHDGDTVYVAMKHPDFECYDVDTIIVNFTEFTAGLDNVLPDYCNTTNEDIDLNTYLMGADSGGEWSTSSVEAASGFDAVTGTFNPYDLPAGTYEFYYVVGEDPCPIDSAIITITIFEQSYAGEDVTIFVCSGEEDLIDLNDLLVGAEGTGTFVETTVASSGALIDPILGIVDPAELKPGANFFYFIVESDAPCEPDSALIKIIRLGGPFAAFTTGGGLITTENPTVDFVNRSDGGVSYEWTFGDNSNGSSEENPQHVYPSTPGTYNVNLKVVDVDGCVDSTSMEIIIEDVLLFYIPNSFTPDGNNFNDTFKPVFESGFDPYDFHLTIYNRYGEIIYESYDATVGWDGTYGNKGIVPAGVYTWSIEFKEKNTDKRHQHNGHVNVFR